ncbi:MAG: class I SAM-dependent methyltransferase [Acidimicrobiales bacterium]|nr:class I SAM-dependent methyltransferase [Acidimicrobiales bacterium]
MMDSPHFARELFDGLADRYDVLAEVLSLGQNRRWRRAMIDALAASSPGSVLDVATGPAGVAIELASRTGARVTGVDLTPEMLGAGKQKVARLGYGRRIALVVGRAEELPFRSGTFDALSFTYLLRYVADPQATLQEMARVVKPGGAVASLEFLVPAGPVWHPLWLLYTEVVLPAAGYLTGGREWFRVGRFLGPSISGHYRRYPVSWHADAWRRAGIEDVLTRRMSLGGGLVMSGRKSAALGKAAAHG